MNDLISRQAAIEALMVAVDDVGILDGEDIKAVFDNLPSAQPELVWCKDCEQWYTEEDDQYGYCRNHDFWTSDIWFCADGERRRR